jgi:Spy/CpxP family protein refolding chaperone
MSRRTLLAAALALVIAAPMAALAQDAKPADSSAGNNNSGDRNRGGGPGGRWDPQRMTEYMKERLGVNDEEWKVLEPKMQKLRDARRDAMGSMFGGGGSRSGRGDSNAGGGSSGDTRSATDTASRELRDVLDKKDSTAEQITAKLTAFREARDKAKATLATAQKDLKEVLTQRQEAVLVSMGMLD